MAKDGTGSEPKSAQGVPKLSSRRSKQEPPKEEVKVKSVEEEVKNSLNTYTDPEGSVFSCHFHVSNNDKGEVLFNGYNKPEILNPRLKGLNLYARVSYPRYKLDNKEIQEKGKGITKEGFEAFLEIIKCPVCLEIMQDPVNVKTCLHKFCNKCIERFIRVEKKECPICRTSIGSRRLLRKDNKLREIIELLIPNLEEYQTYEQEEVERNIRAISKSEKHRKKMMEIQKIKERQFRAEIEERKEQRTPKVKTPTIRRQEPRPRPLPRQREPLPDRRYRQPKRQKQSEDYKQEINIKFKLKQLSSMSNYPCNPRPGKRILQTMQLDTNDQISLKQLTKFIKMKSLRGDIENLSVAYFVRGKQDRSQFDKITSSETTMKEIQQAYWNKDKIESIYFMI